MKKISTVMEDSKKILQLFNKAEFSINKRIFLFKRKILIYLIGGLALQILLMEINKIKNMKMKILPKILEILLKFKKSKNKFFKKIMKIWEV